MDKFIETQLLQIMHSGQAIVRAIQGIFGYSEGHQAAAELENSDDKKAKIRALIDSARTKKNSVQDAIREVQEMILELKIDGSVREHRNGLLKFHSALTGSIYGRSKEEIEHKLISKLKGLEISKKPRKKDNSPLLSEFFENDYLPYKRRQELRPNSIAHIELQARYMFDHGFDKPMSAYKPKDIETFLYSIPKSNKRLHMQYILNNMFNRALALSIIKSNPCSPIDKVKYVGKLGTAFSFEDQIKFFETVFSSRLDYSQKCYFAILYLTGARRKEALDLTTEHVDFINKILTIPGTKTALSARKIPLTPTVERILRSLHVDCGKFFQFNECKASEIFRKVWKNSEQKMHDLRHTFGTIKACVDRVDIKTVAVLLGHSTISTTVRVYTHPEQLDRGTFLRGDMSDDEKINTYREKYAMVISLIESNIR